MISELIDIFIREAQCGLAALKVAVESHDAPALEIAAHRFIGSSGAMGAYKLASISRDLVTEARHTCFDEVPASVERLEKEFGRVREALQTQRGTPHDIPRGQ